MTPEFLAHQAMYALNFVNWDRFVKDNTSDYLCVFGWIDREKDYYKDFVVLGYNSEGLLWWQTSSKEKTAEIAKILGVHHLPCQRVEDVYRLDNSIKLKRVKEALK